MCNKPLTINGYEVSCRECDQCVASYKNSWVARCVAEKEAMSYAYAITLTYADVDGEPPLGAKVYRYRDVANMWKRIRDAGKKRWGKNIEMRYVIVGEKGTKLGRCHYHGVIFASHPIVELGELTGARSKGFAYKRRLDWSIWGHGYVEFQMADRKGISYALKYILKARMTAQRSKGHGREGRTEWLASSYLWCSKIPPVGASWLWAKLKEMVEVGMCPSSLRVRVPGGGDWYVSGNLQKEMCLFLHLANQEYRQERGKDLAGWKALVNSVSDEIELSHTGEIVNRKPWEWLTNGEIEETPKNYSPERARADAQALLEWYKQKRRIAAPITSARAALRNCGHIVPCEACSESLSVRNRVNIQQEHKFRFAEWGEKNPQGSRESRGDYQARFADWWLTRLRPSRGCFLRDTERLQEQFRRLIPVTKAQHGLAHKGAVGKALQHKAR